jgi:hypothetical protein
MLLKSTTPLLQLHIHNHTLIFLFVKVNKVLFNLFSSVSFLVLCGVILRVSIWTLAISLHHPSIHNTNCLSYLSLHPCRPSSLSFEFNLPQDSSFLNSPFFLLLLIFILRSCSTEYRFLDLQLFFSVHHYI